MDGSLYLASGDDGCIGVKVVLGPQFLIFVPMVYVPLVSVLVSVSLRLYSLPCCGVIVSALVVLFFILILFVSLYFLFLLVLLHSHVVTAILLLWSGTVPNDPWS